MSEMEYAIAINDMIHMHSISLRSRLFIQAIKASAEASEETSETKDAKEKEESASKKVSFESLVYITAYLELLDIFETAKKKFSQDDRGERVSEYPQGDCTQFTIVILDRSFRVKGCFGLGLKVKVVPNKNPIISADALLKMASNFSQYDAVYLHKVLIVVLHNPVSGEREAE